MSDVVALLETSNAIHGKSKVRMDEETDQASLSIVSHLYPADCTNILTAMKSIVTSFTDRRHDEELESPFLCKSASCHRAQLYSIIIQTRRRRNARLPHPLRITT